MWRLLQQVLIEFLDLWARINECDREYAKRKIGNSRSSPLYSNTYATATDIRHPSSSSQSLSSAMRFKRVVRFGWGRSGQHDAKITWNDKIPAHHEAAACEDVYVPSATSHQPEPGAATQVPTNGCLVPHMIIPFRKHPVTKFLLLSPLLRPQWLQMFPSNSWRDSPWVCYETHGCRRYTSR